MIAIIPRLAVLALLILTFVASCATTLVLLLGGRIPEVLAAGAVTVLLYLLLQHWTARLVAPLGRWVAGRAVNAARRKVASHLRAHVDAGGGGDNVRTALALLEHQQCESCAATSAQAMCPGCLRSIGARCELLGVGATDDQLQLALRGLEVIASWQCDDCATEGPTSLCMGCVPRIGARLRDAAA